MAKDVVGAALDSPYRDVPFERVFVADASRHGAREINEALASNVQGLDVVLAPGIFGAQRLDQNGAARRRRDGHRLCHAGRAGVGRALRDRGRRRRHAPGVRRASGERGAGGRLVAAALGRRRFGIGPVGPERRVLRASAGRVAEGARGP